MKKKIPNFEEFTKTVNEGVNYKKIENIVFSDFDDYEMNINEILDMVFKKFPDADIMDIKKALVKMTGEIIDNWVTTTGG